MKEFTWRSIHPPVPVAQRGWGYQLGSLSGDDPVSAWFGLATRAELGPGSFPSASSSREAISQEGEEGWRQEAR